YRTTVLLRFFEGLPPGRIAAREGVPLETVRSRLKRGLATLRSELQDGGSGAWPARLVMLAGAPKALSGSRSSVGALLLPETKVAVVAAVVVVASLVIWVMARNQEPVTPSPPVAVDANAEANAIPEGPPPAKAAPVAGVLRPRAFDQKSESEPAAVASRAD